MSDIFSNKNTLFYSKGVISFINDPSEEIVYLGLKTILSNIDSLWISLVHHEEKLQSFILSKNIQLKQLALYVLSKICYFKNEITQSLEYALESGDNLDINNTDKYTTTIFSKIFQEYVKNINNNTNDPRLELNMQKIFKKGILSNKDSKLLIGIAIESKKIDILKQVLQINNNNSNILQYVIDFILSYTQSIIFRDEVIKLLYEIYNNKNDKTFDDYYKLSYCLQLLNNSNDFSTLLKSLFKENNIKFILLGYQILYDTFESENTDLITHLNENLSNSDLKDDIKNNISLILSGNIKTQIDPHFLSQNSHINYKLANFLRSKFLNKYSINHNSIISLYSFLYFGTSDEGILKEEALFKVKNWAQFSLIGSIGGIFKNSNKFNNAIAKYLNAADKFSKGGAYYACGLSLPASKNQEKINLFESNLTPNSKDDNLVFGASLGLGLVNFCTKNERHFAMLKPFLLKDNAVQGMGAGIAIGLIMCSELNRNYIGELIKIAKECIHEKIVTGIMMGIALMAFQKEELANYIVEDLIEHKNYLLRVGAVQALSMAYCSTNNNAIIQKLLNLTATDVNKDVKKYATIGLAFVLLKDKQKLLNVYKMLQDSYNEDIRYGICIGLGIAFSGTGDEQAIEILSLLSKDKIDIVKNGAFIGLGLVFQLHNKNNNKKVEEYRNIMIKKATENNDTNLVKMGCLIGLGLIESGGNNCSINLISPSNTIKKLAISGIFLFTNYWNWYPLINMITLSFEPSYIVGLNKNMKIPESFKMKCIGNKKEHEYYIEDQIQDKIKKFENVKIDLSLKKKVGIEANNSENKKENNEETNNKVKPEEITKDYIISNPSRILTNQRKRLIYLEDQRYEVILKNRTNGIIFLYDKNPEINEEFKDDKPMEKHLIPPLDFIFTE